MGKPAKSDKPEAQRSGMMPAMELTFEERMEREVSDLKRDIGFMIQAQRLLAQALGVHDAFEQLAHSFEHRYPTEPGVDE